MSKGQHGTTVLGYVFLVVGILGGFACDPPPIDNRAPPITDGKCVVDHYEGKVATAQVCTLAGYSWKCQVANCDRMPETALERPAK